jgi:hypothetical protein
MPEMAMTFLQYCLFDTDWRQRQDIDHMVEVEATDFGAVQQQLAAARAQIRELSITIGVLVRMLAENVPVEADTLKYRVEAAIDAMSVEATGRLTCVRCGALRLPAQTMMTGDGPICDPGCPVKS